MKNIFAGMMLYLLATAFAAQAEDMPAIIPQPQQLERQGGWFQFASTTKILADAGSLSIARQLAAQLRPASGYQFSVNEEVSRDQSPSHGIVLTTQNADASLGAEGYELSVTTNGVVIRAPTSAGLFYGMQTLLQLLPPRIFSTNLVSDENWQVPCVQIRDWPRFP